MSFKDRLSRLTGDAVSPSASGPKQEKIGELRKKINDIMAGRERLGYCPTQPPKTPPVKLETTTPGDVVATSLGCFFCSRTVLGPLERYGHGQIGDFAQAGMAAAAFLSGVDLKGFSLEDGLFIDTETTGLSGGVGTFPFLIGLGWFNHQGFVTRQLFARDFSEEPAMLTYLQALAADRRFLVSFNGKAYDLNLLSSRFVLNRLKDTLSGLPHLDLLHPSRRVYAHRLDNTRLSTLEARVLGVRREKDVPGQEIPQRYFDWLRQRDGRLMADVFLHNRMDIVSLASLLKRLGDLVENKMDRDAHPGDLLAMARLCHERGDIAAAKRMLEPLSREQRPDIAREARKYLSLCLKKTQNWDAAAAVWEEMLRADPGDAFAAIEMAKWREHRARDLDAAARAVRDLLTCRGGELPETDRLAALHRLNRLVRKSRGTLDPMDG